ncbi:MAG: alpha-galactosidase [Firmicutes bacterium]|nr:alpha-galactosidase [Bacillota bacterium]
MAIIYNEELKTFSLHTKNSSYQMKIGKLNYLYHLYYGPSMRDEDLSYQIMQYDRGFSGNPYEARNQRIFSLDALPQEFSTLQQGDFRISSIEVSNGDGSYSFNGRVKSFKIYDEKYELKTLPASFSTDKDHVQSLEIVLEDEITKVEVVLLYSVFEEAEIITRSAKVINGGSESIHLRKIMSMCLDFMNGSDLEVLHLPGRYGQERQVERQRLTHQIHTISSGRGSSSHQQNPFVILCNKDTRENAGICYGTALVYSGNFVAEIELDQYDQVRMLMGINNKQFDFELKPGEEFEAPEVLMGFTDKGFTGLSHMYHDFFRNNMCKSKFVHEYRPILINTWEATFFTFDDVKLVEIAKAAKKMGVELMVMDDGWFGKRDDDNSGLGDWYVNTNKIKCGLNNLVEQINDIGLKFGIWFEPEMVSEDSDLYRAHPDWAMQIPGRPAVRSRNQLVLDLTRKDVQDYLIESVNKILDSANIFYAKWDVNRSITDIFSTELPGNRQGEVYHRYILGLYRILDGIVKTHPNILFEGCSGGGGRYDPGMLTYFPQYWNSDNTKPIDNLKLHYGTSFLYPICTMGAHVSEANPNIPISTKGTVAMCGTFGYELDATKLTAKKIKECKRVSKLYKKYYPIIFYGDYYRLTNPFVPGNLTAWSSVTKNKEEALISVVVTNLTVNGPQEYIRARGLNPDWKYYIDILDQAVSGSVLMHVGIPIPREVPEYTSYQYHLKHVRK